MKLLCLKTVYIYFLGCLLLLGSASPITAVAAKTSKSTVEIGRGEFELEYQPGHLSTNSKFYVDKKENLVMEVGPVENYHVFEGDEASLLMRQTKSDLMKEVNYFQSRSIILKYQLGALSKSSEFDLERSPFESIESRSKQLALPNVIQPSNITDIDEDETHRKKRFSILPGTLWCGKGSIAKSELDLGLHTESDKCCRQHDQCTDFMESKSCKHGLCNNWNYRVSNCDCDNKLRFCLQHDRSFTAITSSILGNVYFNILKLPCYSQQHPVKHCKKRRNTGECISFEYELAFPTVWQFFPAQPYQILRDVVDKITNRTTPSHLQPTRLSKSYQPS